jgi:hypothetical protein
MIPIKEFIESKSSCVLVRTDFKVDLDSIVNFFDTQVTTEPITYQGTKRHGGWSVQSNTGDISDGWQAGGTPGLTKEQLAKMFPNGLRFKTPTKLYQGPMEQLVNDLAAKKFDARRTRFADLESNANCVWHVDGQYDVLKYGFWRGHIAVKTNSKCLFMFKSNDGEEKVVSYTIPADGYLYLANINVMHRVINNSDESRVHILTDTALPIVDFQANVEPILSL